MSAISQLFCHLATVSTPASGTDVDADNQPIPGAPVVTTGVRCRLMDLSVREFVTITAGGLTDIKGVLLIGPSVAVAQGSRITDVTDRAGTPLAEPGPFEVKQITTRRSVAGEYRALLLERVA